MLAAVSTTATAAGFWVGLFYLWWMRIELITVQRQDRYSYYRLELTDGSVVHLSPEIFTLDPS
ncbi:hypothetical protein BSZ39_09255 [Bowdeniella nasicola]|uniref:Uncharacterized protein n=1 Tax=Bowdeniella nasicola TaxID=208480 RepID=A0A1Q5Q1A6_9ACTO|nr:hypothetical protein [Bowdeniella nasicola]OKL53495.1 hypothetical protein BSZ39_09255 [Bowdeniella nasicola]